MKVSIENFSETEISILGMLVGEMTEKEIAFALEISENELKNQIKNIFAKLEIYNRNAAATVAIKHGLVQLDV